ncbi:MAG: hypothetical protein QNJ90_11050 [Planctomycetota bacterium]|nr:hypothetical protein [Planctomycetota bacterium]
MRSAKRTLLGLVAVYALVLASPELAVGTALKRVSSTDARCEAHFAAWHAATLTTAAVVRSPEPAQTASRSTAQKPEADPVQLSRPADPLLRLEHAPLAQYGGDLESLTDVEVPESDESGQ